MHMKSKSFALSLAALPVVLALALPAAASDESTQQREPGFGQPGSANEANRTIDITAVDLAFKPNSVTVMRGQTVKFVVTDKGKLTHAFVIGPKSVQEEHDKEMRKMTPAQRRKEMAESPNGILLQPGQTKTLTWTFDTPLRQLQYACHVPGHYQAGMFGTIRIGSVE